MTDSNANIRRLREAIGDIPWRDFESLILNTASVWRPVKGHSFETWFDKLMETWGYESKHVGGDDAVDRVVNSKTLQLKTINTKETKEGIVVAYNLHKTHGLEKRPYNLYKLGEFADFLVGLRTEGTGSGRELIICPKSRLPEDRHHPGYLLDPVKFEWNTIWLNKFDLIGITKTGKDIPNFVDWKKNKLFPRIGQATLLTDDELVATLLSKENFRVLEQNIKGVLREWYFNRGAGADGVVFKPNENISVRDKDKVDFITRTNKKIQLKGITRSITRLPLAGVEVKGSHGRIPQRLYKVGDFDYLVVALDPYMTKQIRDLTQDGSVTTSYNFVVIPAGVLPLHERSGEWGGSYYKDIFKFDIRKVKFNDFSLLK